MSDPRCGCGHQRIYHTSWGDCLVTSAAGQCGCKEYYEVNKTPGQLAYEQDVAASPTYPDDTPRRTWDELDENARWSWERDPTPRS